MIQNIVSAVIVVIIHAVLAVFGVGAMLLTMNGYNDKAAEAAIFANGVSQIVFVIISASFAVLACWYFQSKLNWNALPSIAMSVLVSMVVVVVLTVVAFGIGAISGDIAFKR
jgi:uncharacterized membrane protein